MTNGPISRNELVMDTRMTRSFYVTLCLNQCDVSTLEMYEVTRVLAKMCVCAHIPVTFSEVSLSGREKHQRKIRTTAFDWSLMKWTLCQFLETRNVEPRTCTPPGTAIESNMSPVLLPRLGRRPARHLSPVFISRPGRRQRDHR